MSVIDKENDPILLNQQSKAGGDKHAPSTKPIPSKIGSYDDFVAIYDSLDKSLPEQERWDMTVRHAVKTSPISTPTGPPLWTKTTDFSSWLNPKTTKFNFLGPFGLECRHKVAQERAHKVVCRVYTSYCYPLAFLVPHLFAALTISASLY